MTMIFRHAFHGDRTGEHPRHEARPDRPGRLRPAESSRMRTLEGDALFIDVANENVEHYRNGSQTSESYPKENEDEFVAELQELFTATTREPGSRSTRCRSSARCSR